MQEHSLLAIRLVEQHDRARVVDTHSARPLRRAETAQVGEVEPAEFDAGLKEGGVEAQTDGDGMLEGGEGGEVADDAVDEGR